MLDLCGKFVLCRSVCGKSYPTYLSKLFNCTLLKTNLQQAFHDNEFISVFQCSKSCWFGHKQKMTYCRTVLSKQNQYMNGLRTASYKSCPLRQHSLDHKCNGKNCIQTVFWKVGKWSKVRYIKSPKSFRCVQIDF